MIWVICAYALDSDNIYWNYIVGYWTITTHMYCIARHASVSKQAAAAAAAAAAAVAAAAAAVAAAAASNHDRCQSGKQL